MIKIRRPEKKLSRWPELREWLNALVAVAALLVAIVSLWTTARISGLEDYFRSEISSRNATLETTTIRASRIEAEIAARQIELSRLQMNLDALEVKALTQQGDLSEARYQVNATQQDLSAARGAVDAARTDLASLQSQSRTQPRALSIAYKKEALLAATFAAGLSGDSDRVTYDPAPARRI